MPTPPSLSTREENWSKFNLLNLIDVKYNIPQRAFPELSEKIWFTGNIRVNIAHLRIQRIL